MVMPKSVGEIWKAKEGSKTLWKYQAPRGILTFKTKKEAILWSFAERYDWKGYENYGKQKIRKSI